jgi:hypothetical protein
MIGAFSLILSFAFIPLAHGQDKQKGQKELSPSGVIKGWYESLAKGDLEAARKLMTFKSVPKKN